MQLYSTPENPLPEGAICVPVRTHDGMELRALRATAENPRGTVILLGGRADYMERYFETIRDGKRSFLRLKSGVNKAK